MPKSIVHQYSWLATGQMEITFQNSCAQIKERMWLWNCLSTTCTQTKTGPSQNSCAILGRRIFSGDSCVFSQTITLGNSSWTRSSSSALRLFLSVSLPLSLSVSLFLSLSLSLFLRVSESSVCACMCAHYRSSMWSIIYEHIIYNIRGEGN